MKYLHNPTRSINKLIYETVLSYFVDVVQSRVIRRWKMSLNYWIDISLTFCWLDGYLLILFRRSD